MVAQIQDAWRGPQAPGGGEPRIPAEQFPEGTREAKEATPQQIASAYRAPTPDAFVQMLRFIRESGPLPEGEFRRRLGRPDLARVLEEWEQSSTSREAFEAQLGGFPFLSHDEIAHMLSPVLPSAYEPAPGPALRLVAKAGAIVRSVRVEVAAAAGTDPSVSARRRAIVHVVATRAANGGKSAAQRLKSWKTPPM
jgi:hypothetical protein